MQAWVEEAIIEQQLGRLHFPSDHALLRLTIRRWSPDEGRQDAERVAYLFRRLADIRVRPKDDDRANIEFDDTQYRTDVVKEQEELFGSMQLITGESAPLTTQLLGPVRDKLDELAMSLWEAAQEQGVDGPRGLLVRPTAGQVDRMEGIASEFDEAVKAVMAKGNLMWKGSATEMAKKARRKLQSAGEPTDFARMKTTTKLRFTRVEVQRVRARLLRINAAYAQKAMRRSASGIGTISPKIRMVKDPNRRSVEAMDMAKELQVCLDDTALATKASECEIEVQAVLERWWDHTNAIRLAKMAEGGKQRPETGLDKVYDDIWGRAGGDALRHLDEPHIKSINKCLRENGCTHLFNKDVWSGPANNRVSMMNFEDWKEPVRKLREWQVREAPNDPRFATLPFELLDQALAALRAINNRLIWLQSRNRSCFANYCCNANKTGLMTRRLLPKERRRPVVHGKKKDRRTGATEFCTSEAEQLQATKEYHQRWMDASGADEEVAHCKLVVNPILGIRGVQLLPDREVIPADLGKLLPNHKSIPRETANAYVEAHRRCVAELFRTPAEPDPLFKYPFYQGSEDGKLA